ncbi:MAG: phosphoribosylamine--glycine ligase, partial [Clostridia bacterium]|nr:phosphoribosylamine--glycine ligase [Clostridia bacterium]
KFGKSGSTVVVEEFLTGPEVSVLAFTDGKVVKPMVSSMDHKRIGDNDTGLNTGGIGTVAPNPYYTKSIADECMETIFLPTINAMNAEGRTFKGCLYFGLMLTPNGPKVIEYNCRFGDPETQVVLPLLESDLLDVMQATTNGTLADTEVKFANKHACCVILASNGYPTSYKKGFEMTFTEEALVATYVAGAKLENGKLVTSGGRVTGTTAIADSLEEAIKEAYRLSDGVKFEGAYRRSDIGKRALMASN